MDIIKEIIGFYDTLLSYDYRKDKKRALSMDCGISLMNTMDSISHKNFNDVVNSVNRITTENGVKELRTKLKRYKNELIEKNPQQLSFIKRLYL